VKPDAGKAAPLDLGAAASEAAASLPAAAPQDEARAASAPAGK
jgi:hypothetical protein